MKDIVISIYNNTRLVYKSNEEFAEARIERYDGKYSNEWYNGTINGFYFSHEEFPKIVEAFNRLEKLLILT